MYVVRKEGGAGTLIHQLAFHNHFHHNSQPFLQQFTTISSTIPNRFYNNSQPFLQQFPTISTTIYNHFHHNSQPFPPQFPTISTSIHNHFRHNSQPFTLQFPQLTTSAWMVQQNLDLLYSTYPVLFLLMHNSVVGHCSSTMQ